MNRAMILTDNVMFKNSETYEVKKKTAEIVAKLKMANENSSSRVYDVKIMFDFVICVKRSNTKG